MDHPIIHKDAHGNAFATMVDGANVPLVPAHINTTLVVLTAIEGVPTPVGDAIALHQTAAKYWYEKACRLEAENADLKAQVTELGGSFG